MDYDKPVYPFIFSQYKWKCVFGAFKEMKGLRQGDLILPLIFVVLMEYFTRTLKKMSRKEGFNFHHRCASLGLTHLIFADDLMLFCNGDISSVILMVRAVKDFSLASGLYANNDKTALYFGNVQEEIRLIRSLQATGFTKGAFPFRYLGDPITTRKLKVADCDLLVDNKILLRVICCSYKNLSYAARHMLVNAVLHSLQTY